MKKDTHPENYRDVAFKDVSTGDVFVIKSVVDTKDTIDHEGQTYPLFNIDVSSASHPFYKGTTTSLRAAGRVERFKRMFDKTSQAKK